MQSKETVTYSAPRHPDLKVGKRIVLEDAILPVFGHTSARVGTSIFVFGGRTAVKPVFTYTQMHLSTFNVSTDQRPDFRSLRQHELGFGAETAQLLHYTHNNWCVIEAANAPCPRAFHSMVSVGPLLFVFGGLTSPAAMARGRVGQHVNIKVRVCLKLLV